MVLHKGKVVLEKGYGNTNYESKIPVTGSTIYDIASVTKTTATTAAVMYLYEKGLLDLDKTLKDYLPEFSNTGKAGITIRNLLMHQAGFISFIPFYKELLDTRNNLLPEYVSNYKQADFEVPVTEHVYLKDGYPFLMMQRIKNSELSGALKYVYSDNDFILLGKIVEKLTRQTLDAFVQEQFYQPMSLTNTMYKVYNEYPLPLIAPTEDDKLFRKGLVWGYVHDQGAAMMGNVAGHAGLFSNAMELAAFYQMLINGGHLNGKKYFKKETIDLFTAYQTPISRRALGFDKPEKNNSDANFKDAYPARYLSSTAFGHTGFTGTCVWADPANEIVYVFLSNRVYPNAANNKLSSLNIRQRIHEVIYETLMKGYFGALSICNPAIP
ncbi:serine hydrolase [Chitinophagaceae bacterium LY-5]|uniref:Serine hydrolase n=1 Tax=Polluticaenibacter yanchengensis TaxID=3014562 RepID=A0ABT4UJ85_9BACT|nr:serine hydrolase [Chitinophagaceae bacterium LY-5]